MEEQLLGLALILILGVGAQWLAWRLRLPSILMLLLFGFLAGPITGIVDPDHLFNDTLFPLVSVSVAVILFEGGLTLELSELPRVGNVIFRLISLGALVTWVVTAVAAKLILSLDWALSILLGAILIVTGPTVIGPLLRQIRPKGKSSPVLKWEGILIDPVGAIMAVLVFEVIIGEDLSQAPSVIVLGVLQTILIGVVLGVLGAGVMIFLLRRYWVPDHLQNAVSLLLAVGVFAVSNMLHPEAGLLTVTLMGVILANQKWVSIRHIVEFKENLRVLLIGSLFIILAARLSLAEILELGWRGALFASVLVLIGRPLAVLVSTIRSELSWSERLFLSWMAPRGIVAAAVASVFAFELIEYGHQGAAQIVSITFLVIVTTVSLYGLTAGQLARRLKLSEQNPQGVVLVGGHALNRAIGALLQSTGFRVVLVDMNKQNIRLGEQLGLEMHLGDALGEEVVEDLDFTGIGRLLALTSNNEVNALAALHFSEMFGRSEVYQLPVENGAKTASNRPNHLRGRFLFGSVTTFRFLKDRFETNFEVKLLPVTAAHDYVAIQDQYNNQVIPLFLITERQQLIIYTADFQPIPRSGQSLICLAPASSSHEITNVLFEQAVPTSSAA